MAIFRSLLLKFKIHVWNVPSWRVFLVLLAFCITGTTYWTNLTKSLNLGGGSGVGNSTALMCWFSNRHVGFISHFWFYYFIFIHVFMIDYLIKIFIIEIVYSRCKRIYDDDDDDDVMMLRCVI